MDSANNGAALRKAVRFRFGGETVALDRFSPRATVLDWLRESVGAKGTKEGCAEGDCGACTVVLVRNRNGRLTYDAVNACILLLGQLDGAELITVEDLAEGDALHPVQQAMVDRHGSQCGFCTPGIVMSLFAAYHSGAPRRERACAISSPAISAAARATDRSSKRRSKYVTERPTTDLPRSADPRSEALVRLDDKADVFVGDERSFFAAPAGLDSLAALYARFPDATLVAGATDVGLWVTKQLRDLKRVIWLGRTAGLDSVGETADGALSLGAGVTLSDAAPLLGAIHPDLGELMRRFGSIQVRTSGTVGGNIANGSPIGDIAPALIALGGRVVLRKGPAIRTLLLEDFFIAYGKQDRAPGEFVLAVEAPRLGDAQHFRAFKVSKRFDEDISAVMLAARLEIDAGRVNGVRISCGGMAAIPKRATNAEKALVGADLQDPSTWRLALAALSSDFTPLTDQRASASYRMSVATNLLEKTLIEIGGASVPTRIGALHAAE